MGRSEGSPYLNHLQLPWHSLAHGVQEPQVLVGLLAPTVQVVSQGASAAIIRVGPKVVVLCAHRLDFVRLSTTKTEPTTAKRRQFGFVRLTA